MNDDDRPRYSTKRLRYEIARARDMERQRCEEIINSLEREIAGLFGGLEASTRDLMERARLLERDRCAEIARKYACDEMGGEARLCACYILREIMRQ